MNGSAPDRTLGKLLLGGLVGAGIFFWNAWPSWQTVVDDAYISARYARSLAEGQGLTFSAGEPPVEGITNLAWTVLLSLGYAAGAPMHGLMTGLGFFFGLLSLLFAGLLTTTLIGRRTPWALVPVFLLAIDSHLAVIATNGLESSMWVAGVLGASWATLAARGQWRWVAGIGVGSLVAIRPEGVVVAGLLALFDLFRHRRSLGTARSWAIALPALVWLVGIEVFRLAYFGDVVPNTFHAKSSDPLARLNKNNLRYIWPDRLYWFGSLALLLISMALPVSKDASSETTGRLARAVLAGIGLALVAIAWSVILWMPGGRLLVPAAALAVCLGISGVALLPNRVALVVVGLVVAGYGYCRVALDKPVRRADRVHSMEPENGAMKAALHLQVHGPEGAWLATRDGGVFPYYVGHQTRVAEIHNRALTRPHPDGADARILTYVPRNPEYVVLTVSRPNRGTHYYNNDRRVFQRLTEPYAYLGRVEQHYHRYYDVYVRSDLGIPPLPDEIVMNFRGVKPKHPGN